MDDELHHPEGGDLRQEVNALRSRVHRMADMVQSHEGTIREHGVLIPAITNQLEGLRQSTATRDQLSAAVTSMNSKVESTALTLGAKLETTATTLGLKMEHMREDLAPIKRGMYWAVALILAAVLSAILALVLRGPG